MNKMWAPVSVRRARFMSEKPNSTVAGLKYLFRNLRRIVVSDKYIMERNVLVLDVVKDSSKRFLERAMSSIDPTNKVLKINTLVRKATSRVFRGTSGTIGAYKRVYIRFEKEIDPKVFYVQTESEEI